MRNIRGKMPLFFDNSDITRARTSMEFYLDSNSRMGVKVIPFSSCSASQRLQKRHVSSLLSCGTRLLRYPILEIAIRLCRNVRKSGIAKIGCDALTLLDRKSTRLNSSYI